FHARRRRDQWPAAIQRPRAKSALREEGRAMSLSQHEKAARFRALHDGPGVFVIPNPWDIGSTRILAGLGFQALATSSAASAVALGPRDGQLTRGEALAHPRAIVDPTDLPAPAD